MAYINTKSSVFAIEPETTQGEPVEPTGATSFVAEQDDFTMGSSFEQLENAERLNSLGSAKTISGLESATANGSHYLRHSGVTGTAPAYDAILKSLFGVQTDYATERDTVAGSTTTVINVDAGEGTEFPRGRCLRIQDGVNGHTIRPVHSVSTDALTLGFALDSAPAAGVNLGLANTFSPLNDGSNQTLTLWEYMGNGGMTRMVSGARCVGMDATFTAGQLVNASYSFEALRMFVNPIKITSANKYIDFDDGVEQNASVAEQWYSSPHELADAIATAANAESTDTITCTFSDVTGKFTIASDGVTFELLAKTGTHGSDNSDDHIFTTLGYDDTADYTAATTYTSDDAQSYAAPYTPSYDSNVEPLAAKNMTVLIGDQDDNSNFSCGEITFNVSVPATDIMDVTSKSGKAATISNARTCTVSVTATAEKHECDKFYRMTKNKDTRAMFVVGTKTNDEWDAGKTVAVYLPTCTVSNVQYNDADGLYELTFDLNTYVDADGNGEVYLNFL